MKEEKAQFIVGNAFYRSQTKIVRDLGILAAAIYQADTGKLRVLDAMAGCGVRSLRYWLESGADWLWVNEGNPEMGAILKQNLNQAISSKCAQVTHINANQVFFDCYSRQDYFDLVDVDSFGSAAPYLNTALWATKIGGLLYFTSTDGRTATGHLPDNSLRVYGAYARAHPAAHEQALRLLIGSVQQQAATKGLGIQPIFSLFSGQTYRVMLRLTPKPNLTVHNYGFLGFCHSCGEYQTVNWRQLGKVMCPHDGKKMTISGAMWLGSLHNCEWLRKMNSLAQSWQWQQQSQLLETMVAEADLPPYFYTLAEIGSRGKLDLPKRDHLIMALKSAGYQASTTHINAQAIKTDADLYTCIKLAKKIFQKSGKSVK